MTVVIDVGAAQYGGDYSMERLIEQFEPEWLYGIDPNPDLTFPLAGTTKVELISAAAWVHDGTIGYQADGLNSWVTDRRGAPTAPCFDLARFIRELDEKHNDRLILKLDCEGAEYELLPHLIMDDVDELLDLTIVEWHDFVMTDPAKSREAIEKQIRCELQEWPY